MWETVPLALKQAKKINKFKKLYKAHYPGCQRLSMRGFRFRSSLRPCLQGVGDPGLVG